jgi:hypothetical protein
VQTDAIGFDAKVDGEIFTSTDITDIIKDGVLAGGNFDMMFWGQQTSGVNAITFDAIEASGGNEIDPNLFFSNVEDMEATTTPPTGTASNVAVPSASALSKSGRPPIAGADRQVTANILHDGVEPMTILSLTLKGDFGTDN